MSPIRYTPAELELRRETSIQAMKRLLPLAFLLATLASGCSFEHALADDSAHGQTAESTQAEPPKPPRARFQGRVTEIRGSTRARMRWSWRPGCPVTIRDLRLVTVTHWGFDGRVHRGELVVHEDSAEDLVHVLHALFRARFPIERMRLVDEYRGDDERSMAANNTSAFNCRGVPGSGSWSEHAYGRAIDVNPVQNPEVRDGRVSPAAGRAFVERGRRFPGMVRPGDRVVRAFAAIGWEWGGDWRSLKDYQHFSASGR